MTPDRQCAQWLIEAQLIKNARWQCRPSYERTPNSRSIQANRVQCSVLRDLCRFASPAIEPYLFEALFAEDRSFTFEVKKIPVDSDPHRQEAKFRWTRLKGTPCITSGYTAFGSPALLSSSDFKARICSFFHFNI